MLLMNESYLATSPAVGSPTSDHIYFYCKSKSRRRTSNVTSTKTKSRAVVAVIVFMTIAIAAALYPLPHSMNFIMPLGTPEFPLSAVVWRKFVLELIRTQVRRKPVLRCAYTSAACFVELSLVLPHSPYV